MFENRINKIFLFLIYLSVFVSSYVFTKEPAEIYFGYVVYLLLLPFFIFRYRIPNFFVIIFSLLFLNGFVNSYLGFNTYADFFKIFLGVFFSYLFYYYVLVQFEYNVEKLFQLYLMGCFIVSVIGIIQFVSYQMDIKAGYNYSWILNKWGFIPGGNLGIRINSIFPEPTHFGACVSAAAFVSFYNLLMKKTYYLSRFQSMIIVLVYFMTFSGLAFIAFFVIAIILLFNFGFIRYAAFFAPVLVGAFLYLYNNVEEFRQRTDSTITLYLTGEFEIGKTHGSSLILYNNYFVAMKNLSTNFVFGTGLGSHPVAFSKYSITKNIKIKGIDLNARDANSMFVRLISETGLFGTLLMLGITFRFFIRRKEGEDIPDHFWLISGGIFVMIIANLLRQGHYFLNGFPFFIWLYYYNQVNYNQFLEKKSLHQNLPDDSSLKDVG